MLRLSTPGYLRFSQARQFDATFGGGEANVAVSLANYGVDAHFVTRLPKNDIADMCTAELKGFGVNTDSIVYGGEGSHCRWKVGSHLRAVRTIPQMVQKIRARESKYIRPLLPDGFFLLFLYPVFI